MLKNLSSFWTAVIGIVALAAIIALGRYAVGGSDTAVSPTRIIPTQSQPTLSHIVWYIVEGQGTSRASITYETVDGSQQDSNRRVDGDGWRQQLTVEDGQWLYLAARNNGDSGLVTCRILVDGREWKKTTGSGAGGSCDVSGFVGED